MAYPDYVKFTSRTGMLARRRKGALHAHATIRASGRKLMEEARAARKANAKARREAREREKRGIGTRSGTGNLAGI